MVFDTYASRRGKGQRAAVARARQFAGRHAWFLKCDFRKYFDSIPHEGLRRMLRSKFKDRRLLGWFDRNNNLGFRLCASGSADSAGASVGPRRGPAPDQSGRNMGGKPALVDRDWKSVERPG